MLAKNAIKRIRNYLGCDVTIANGRFVARYEDYVLTFAINGMRTRWTEKALNSSIISIHVRRKDDVSQLQFDYHAGSYFRNITQALHFIKPPPPRFNKGEVVIAKNTKRAQRRGYAKQTGLVIEAKGKHHRVLWSDTQEISIWIESRDFKALC